MIERLILMFSLITVDLIGGIEDVVAWIDRRGGGADRRRPRANRRRGGQ
jgi:hypothetical protein